MRHPKIINRLPRECLPSCMNTRSNQLSLLRSPPKQPKAVTVQARVEESVKTQLECYAEFIDASPSYVIIEAVAGELLFLQQQGI